MARNDRDKLIEKFLSRSRSRRDTKLTSTPNITGTRSTYRPLKQKPVKRPARY